MFYYSNNVTGGITENFVKNFLITVFTNTTLSNTVVKILNEI